MYYCPRDKVKEGVQCDTVKSIAVPKKKGSHSRNNRITRSYNGIEAFMPELEIHAKVSVRCPNQVHYLTVKDIVHPDFIGVEESGVVLLAQDYPMCANTQSSEQCAVICKKECAFNTAPQISISEYSIGNAHMNA